MYSGQPCPAWQDWISAGHVTLTNPTAACMHCLLQAPAWPLNRRVNAVIQRREEHWAQRAARIPPIRPSARLPGSCDSAPCDSAPYGHSQPLAAASGFYAASQSASPIVKASLHARALAESGRLCIYSAVSEAAAYPAQSGRRLRNETMHVQAAHAIRSARSLKLVHSTQARSLEEMNRNKACAMKADALRSGRQP